MPIKKERLVVFTRPKADPTKPKPKRRSESYGFMPTPREVFYKKSLSATEKLVALWLYDHLKPGTHIATGGQCLIADDLQLNKRTVALAIKQLEKYAIILTTTRYPNSRGGYFNAYSMRIYDNVVPRESENVKRFVLREDKAEMTAKDIARKVKTGKLGRSGEGENETCPRCQGTKWEQVQGTRDSRRCPDCFQGSGKTTKA